MKHCILAKYKEHVTAEQKTALLDEIREVFSPLLQEEGIHALKVIPNCIDRSNRWDVLIRIDMNPEALPAYDESLPHKRWKEQYGPLLEKKAIFDYE